MTINDLRLSSIFMPRAMKELKRFVEPNGPDFVHYTSAENFMNIFNVAAPSIWMRNAKCMNDVSEIEHGLSRITLALSENNRLKRLKAALNGCHDQLGEYSIGYFNHHLNGFLSDTYITCVSEHDAVKEDDIGRLSMWRAYGQGSIGIAIVLNKFPFLSETNYLEAFSSPVAYIGDRELGGDIETIISNIDLNREWLSSLPEFLVMSQVFNMLKFGIICLKHKGFEEEKEWRVIHTPSVTTSSLEQATVTVSGVPQRVFKIAFKDYTSERGAFDISPNSIVKRVIIGPSNYPGVIRDAVIDTLEKVGVMNAKERVVISDIPLRTLI
ncbi:MULTISPECIES: DUF2971 domain-containing protein [unclassified Brucella]|uniref:DUF2971 domain-containing protein n=1 Tax=unclassified Brucella TaxID=2632610 RepID=UPI0009726832|nr:MULTISPECIES: DUF2971 domain-containing protein [unclassified Brucella]APX67987.1 hypothetical protein BKD03_00325 [Brucella sp. 09RB8471]MRN79865.1 DUF2971 domain-containing protein [Brucella sp. 10RB9210]